MSKITSIERQARKKDRYSVFIDGVFAFGANETVIASLGLKPGQEVDAAELEKMLWAENVHKAKEQALRLLDYRQRSKNEISRRLAQKGYEQDVIQEVLNQLERLGLLDDEQFSKQWVRSRLLNKPMGKRGLTWELRNKGIPETFIEETLKNIDDHDEFEAALNAAKRKLNRKVSDVQAEKQRLASFLRRRGFNWDTISSVIEKILEEGEDVSN